MRALVSSRGYSLVELLVAMVLTLVVGLAGFSFYRAEVLDFREQSARLDAGEGVRMALGLMAQEIRRAGYDPRDSAFRTAGLPTIGATGVSLARADRLRIEMDENGSGAIDANAADPNPESVLYVYDSANRRLLRTVAGATQVVARNVPPGGVLFEYFDGNGQPIPLTGFPLELTASGRDSIRLVRVRLQVRTVGGPRASTLELTTRSALRNRILNRL